MFILGSAVSRPIFLLINLDHSPLSTNGILHSCGKYSDTKRRGDKGHSVNKSLVKYLEDGFFLKKTVVNFCCGICLDCGNNGSLALHQSLNLMENMTASISSRSSTSFGYTEYC